MPSSHSRTGRRTNEDVFFAFYPRLLEWATQITHRDRQEAEDLVHDLYFRITRVSRSIDEVESIDSYLFKVLRNLYFSRLRRAGRDPINDLSIVDYDSIEHGLVAADRRELLFVRANLREVCRYACQRKSTARSASVLILRFFLGYYASEVMKILQAPRSSVDRSLQVARHEARIFLERPGVLRFISQRPQPNISFAAEGEDTHKLFLELREAIFSVPEGECFASSAIEQRYASDSQLPSLTASELAHLVSCKICLDKVNAILDLPSLEERSPEYGLDRDHPSGRNGGAGSGPSSTRKSAKKGPSLSKLERSVREHYEHRPESLQIAVDGEVRTSQKITAEKSEFHLRLARKEEPSFVEIFSEQGFCMAYLDVAAPGSSDELEQIEEVLLSDNRSLTLTLDFAADAPIVHVLYRDPVVAEGTEISEEAAVESGVALSDAKSISDGMVLEQFVYRPGRWIRHWASKSFWRLRQYLRPVIHNMNPFLASGVILTFCAIVCFWIWLRSAPPMSAGALLQHAEAAEQVVASPAEQKVIYQKIRIRTSGQSIERSIYRDAGGRRKPKQQPLDRQALELQTKLATAGVKWDEPLSASTYQDWREHSRVTHDNVQNTDGNLLVLTTTVADRTVAAESLTVRASDFHPVARTISFRDTGNVEIAELDYAVLPWSDAVANWFEPIGAMSSELRGTGARLRGIPHLAAAPLTEEQIDGAELGAMLILHELRADAENRLQIIRRPNGVQVKGIVEDDTRKRDLETRLSMVPHVTPSIFTFQELDRQSRVTPSGEAQDSKIRLESDEEHISPLEKFLTAKGESRDEVSRLANRLSDSADMVNRESAQLAELMHRFGPDQQLTQSVRAMLEQLVAERKASILAALDEEEHSLEDAGLSGPPPADIQKVLFDFEEATKQNRRLCDELVFDDASQSRTAQEILPELARAIRQLHAATLELSRPRAQVSTRKEQ